MLWQVGNVVGQAMLWQVGYVVAGRLCCGL